MFGFSATDFQGSFTHETCLSNDLYDNYVFNVEIKFKIEYEMLYETFNELYWFFISNMLFTLRKYINHFGKVEDNTVVFDT